VAETLVQHLQQTGHFATTVGADPATVHLLLDRGHTVVIVETKPEPGDFVDLAVKVGIQKFLALGDDQGLEDDAGLVSSLSPELLLAGLERSRFHTKNPEFLALARQAAIRGIPALHLVDGRIPHALVGELFTDQGIGTLVTRLAVS
jgi:acetylglutamate kinase